MLCTREKSSFAYSTRVVNIAANASFLYNKRNMRKWLALFCLILALPAFAAKKPVKNAQELFTAAESKSAKELRKLLDSNSAYANVTRGDDGETLLMAAVRADRDNAVIKEIINAGAAVAAATTEGVTALMLACQYQSHENVIATIISNAGVLKAQKRKLILLADNSGRTAFDYALQNSQSEAMLSQLEKYAERPESSAQQPLPTASATIGEANTSLMQALKEDADIAAIGELLQNTSALTKTAQGVTPLMYACQYQSHEAVIVALLEQEVTVLKQGIDVLRSDDDGKTAYDYALLNANPPWVIDILEHYLENPDLTMYVSKTQLEQRALEEAAKKAEEAAKAADTAPDIVIQPWTPTYLLDYAELDSEDVITEEDPVSDENFRRTFIPEPDKRDRDGRTLLMKAARDGNMELIEDLLYSQADVQLKDNDGWTALMFAARFQDDTAVTARLLKAGAKQGARNNYGLTALALAAGFSDNPDVVALLLSDRSIAEKEIRETFIYAITAGTTTDILALFLEKGISINAPYNGKTPLMYAAETNTNTQLISWLLKHGAKATYKTTSGMTAFDFAQRNSQLPHNEVYWSLNALTTGGN